MRKSMLFVLALLLPAAVQAGAEEELRRYFNEVDTLQGQFTQRTLSAEGDVLERSSGTMAIQRPNRFRWVYEMPLRQIIVADGENLWIHDVALEQVSVRPLEQVLGGGAALLLSGRYEQLTRDFRIEPGEAPGWVKLTAREGGWQFTSVRLRMVDGVPQRLELTDELEQTTVLQLDALERNVSIPAARFRFEPPAGVDVVGTPADAGQ